MNESMVNEVTYLIMYLTIKKLHERGYLSKEFYKRINEVGAEQNNCRPIEV